MVFIKIIKSINFFLFLIMIVLIFRKCNYYENFMNNMNNMYNVYYINLIERIDRKKSLLMELSKCNIPESRIIRIDGIRKKMGSYGCLLSHIKTLEIAMNDNIEYGKY